mgnify:FL=1|jgi:hypothetical protein|tara:strand:+ start:1070 stop:1969 length:900 start_codon:yes stop_codon:yes gene_type:complete
MSTEDDISGQQTGTESALSTYVGPYVTEMLGRGRAIAETPYEAYMGPLTAGTSALQDTAFTGLAGLALPTDASGASAMGTFTPGTFAASGAPAMTTEGADAPAATGVVGEYMNPYLSAVLNPQLEEARRQAEISRQAEAGRFTRAGAFGGSRQALADLERDDRLQRNLADITGKGYAQAFESARRQFNVEQDRAKQAQDMANRFGFDVLGAQTRAGQIQRDIEAEGIAADKAQFEEERDFPYRQVSYMQSLLSGLPLATQSYSYAQPSALSNILAGGGLPDILASIFGIGKDKDKEGDD